MSLLEFDLGYNLTLPGFEGFPINNAVLVVDPRLALYRNDIQTLFNNSFLPVQFPSVFIRDAKAPLFYYTLVSGYMKFLPNSIQIVGRIVYAFFGVGIVERIVNTDDIKYGNSSFGQIVGTLDTVFGPFSGGGSNPLINEILCNQCCPQNRRHFSDFNRKK